MTRAMPRKRYILLIGLLLLGALFVLLHRQILPLALHWLDIGKPPEKADAIFVFLGDNDTRPFVAAALYNNGFADEVLLAKFLPVGMSKQELPTHDIYKDVLMKRGVAEEDIRLLGSPIKNTMTESQVLLEYMIEHPNAIVTVVTNHFHARRTRWSLRRNLGEHAERLRYVTAPCVDFSHDDWWRNVRGFEYVGIEFIKLIAYQFVFGNAVWYTLAAVALLLGLQIWKYRKAQVVPEDQSVYPT